MRILHYLPWASPETRGGTEVFLLNLARLQQERGHIVTVMASANPTSLRPDSIDGIRIAYFDSPYAVSGSMSAPRGQAGVKEQIRTLIGKHAPDVVHLHGIDNFIQEVFQEGVNSEAFGLVLTMHLINNVCPNQNLRNQYSRMCDRPVSFDICARCVSEQRRRGWLTGAIDRVALPVNERLVTQLGFDRVARRIPYQRAILDQLGWLSFLKISVTIDALSPWFVDVLIHNGFSPDRMALRPNPLFDSWRYRVLEPRMKTSSRTNYLVVGRLSTAKGIDLLLESLEFMIATKEKISVTFLGKAEDVLLVKQINGLQDLGFDLRLVGIVGAKEVADHMRKADYLIFPSREEMSPIAVHEAIQLRLPVIGSNLPAVTPLVRDGLNGFLFAAGDAADLERAISSTAHAASVLSFDYLAPNNFDDELNSYYLSLYGRRGD